MKIKRAINLDYNATDYISKGRVIQKKIWLIIPPKKRFIHIENDRDEVESYFLSFPYIFFLIEYYEINNTFIESPNFQICFSNDEKGSNIYFPPLLNVDRELNICMGDISNIYKSEKTLIKSFLQTYWTSKFNFDYSGCQSEYKRLKKQIVNYKYWEEKTKIDPKWIPENDSLIEANHKKIIFNSFDWTPAEKYIL